MIRIKSAQIKGKKSLFSAIEQIEANNSRQTPALAFKQSQINLEKLRIYL
jgi:hypothetical protein